MSDYFKLKVGAVYAENSDYSNPRVTTAYDNYTSSSVTEYRAWLQTIGTVAETLKLSDFTTVDTLIIKNKDATNYVTLAMKSAGNGGTAFSIRIAAGKFAVLPDVTASNDITLAANTAACDCEVTAFGT